MAEVTDRAGAAPAFDWDEHDLDFVETDAAAQHDLRNAIDPVAAPDDTSVVGDTSDSPGRSIADAIETSGVASAPEPAARWRDAGPPEHIAPSCLEPGNEGAHSATPRRDTVSDFWTTPDGYDQMDNQLPPEASLHDGEVTTGDQDELELGIVDAASILTDDTFEAPEDIAIEGDIDSTPFDALLDSRDVESTDDEGKTSLYTVDVGGARLSEYDKAKRLATQTAKRFNEHGDELWPVLLDIFHESPWAITQRSIERLLADGVSCQALALATEIRRIWRDHSEFGQSFPPANTQGESWRYSQEAMSQLSWPRAARLADSWPSYPDATEVGHFLEDLYDRWHGNSQLHRSFTSFQLYLGYATGYLDGTLPDWPEFSFESDDALEDSFDELESRGSWSATCEALRRYGIERPMASRPVYVRPKSLAEEKKKTKKDNRTPRRKKT